MRGLKHADNPEKASYSRRTRMGAWIETEDIRCWQHHRPVATVWVRGLKLGRLSKAVQRSRRTRMGAWIETGASTEDADRALTSHPYGCVD